MHANKMACVLTATIQKIRNSNCYCGLDTDSKSDQHLDGGSRLRPAKPLLVLQMGSPLLYGLGDRCANGGLREGT